VVLSREKFFEKIPRMQNGIGEKEIEMTKLIWVARMAYSLVLLVVGIISADNAFFVWTAPIPEIPKFLLLTAFVPGSVLLLWFSFFSFRICLENLTRERRESQSDKSEH
jgi:hypothetical protein